MDPDHANRRADRKHLVGPVGAHQARFLRWRRRCGIGYAGNFGERWPAAVVDGQDERDPGVVDRIFPKVARVSRIVGDVAVGYTACQEQQAND